VLWQESIAPLIALEFVSGNGTEERDKTPWQGKFWIYEQVIKPAFYGIYEVSKASVEVYIISWKDNIICCHQINEVIIRLHLYQNMELPWLRWWDLDGNLLLDGHKTAEYERQRAESEKEKSDRLIAQLRALGVEPEV
jgi:hypothetical protein